MWRRRRSLTFSITFAAVLLLGACSGQPESAAEPSPVSTSAPTATTVTPASTSSTVLPATSSTPAVPKTIDADPFRHLLHDRMDEVYLYSSEVVGPSSSIHTNCMTGVALDMLGPDRLIEPGVVGADSRLSFASLDRNEVEALAETLSAECDLIGTAGMALGFSEPLFGTCIALKLEENGQFDDLILWTMGGDDPSTFEGVPAAVLACQQDVLVDLWSEIDPESPELEISIGQEVTARLASTVPLNSFELQCAALAVTTSLTEPFLERFESDPETDLYTFLNTYEDSDLVVRTAAFRLLDAWHLCVPIASVLEAELGIDLNDAHVTCLNPPRLFELSRALTILRWAPWTSTDAVETMTDLAESRCGLGDST